MAICNAGPHGHPSGKIGKLVFYMLNGQAVCRLVGRAGKATPKQLGNRQGMSVTMGFLKPMADFINVSFKLEAEGTVKNQHNLATSYNKKHALTGEYPNIAVDYSKVILSKGSLEMAKDLEITKGEEGVNFSWNTGIAENGAKDDILMVVISHLGIDQATTHLNAARRSDGSCFIPLFSDRMKNGQMEIYVCFKSADGKLISDSVYGGNLNGGAETKTKIVEETPFMVIKARFDRIAAEYDKKEQEYTGKDPRPKAFRYLETEYFALKNKLAHLEGESSRE